ncbi:serine/threonine-protein kinase [Spirillospora sp. NPDC052242]
MSTQPLRPDDPRTIGPYRLLARLGAGGMGTVFLGRSAGGRAVAIKLVHAGLAGDPEFRRRFRREVDAAREVGGEFTARILDADPDAPVPWSASGYVAGPTLHEVVGEHGPLPERSLRPLAAGLAGALRAVHGHGLVHRDLKPSNVLLTLDGPRVIDFGIARAVDASIATRTGAVIGTPAFMAPEQVRGDRLTPAADVFSLGSVLAFAATGRLPFATEDGGMHALMMRVVSGEPDLAGLDGPLRGLVEACLAKEPGERPSPEEIAERAGAGAGDGPWLPAEVVERLGRHAVALLDLEDPHAPDPSGTAPSGTGPLPAAPAPVFAPPAGAVPPPGPPPAPARGTAHWPTRPPGDGPARFPVVPAAIAAGAVLVVIVVVAVAVALSQDRTGTAATDSTPPFPSERNTTRGEGAGEDPSPDSSPEPVPSNDVPSFFVGTWQGPTDIGGMHMVVRRGVLKQDVATTRLTLNGKVCEDDWMMWRDEDSQSRAAIVFRLRGETDDGCPVLGDMTLARMGDLLMISTAEGVQGNLRRAD